MKRAFPISAAAFLLLSSPTHAEAERELRVYYDDDFVLETTDGHFQLKPRGNIHADARMYQAEERGAPHSLDIRRTRIDLQGRIHRWFTFRLQPEFAGNPYMRNAWVDVSGFPALHLRAGQMKVPFSSSWVTLDNNVNFLERGTSTPIYPFFDRGVLLWGELWEAAVVYNLGAFTGAGIDIDTGAGDIDDHKDLAARLMLQPFRHLKAASLQNLYLVAQSTWGPMSVPTKRFETGGLRSANYETAIWRWRTEQIIGQDGRITDKLSGEIGSRFRWGAELHYLLAAFSLSVEYLELRYDDVAVYHDLMEGSSRAVHEKLFEKDGAIRSASGWISFYFTGEQKRLTNGGWKTPKPKSSVGEGGVGAWELLARYSRTWSDERLFDRITVDGFAAGSDQLPDDYATGTPGADNAVSAAVLDGASDVHEFSVGLCWTLNPMVRLQLNDVFLWAPEADRNGDNGNDNSMLSGGKSDQSNPDRKNAKTSWENAVMARMIFKL